MANTTESSRLPEEPMYALERLAQREATLATYLSGLQSVDLVPGELAYEAAERIIRGLEAEVERLREDCSRAEVIAENLVNENATLRAKVERFRGKRRDAEDLWEGAEREVAELRSERVTLRARLEVSVRLLRKCATHAGIMDDEMEADIAELKGESS